MRLLFDQNLSYKLPLRLSDMYPESIHVRNVGLHMAADSEVWQYARANGFTIVSKDSDFHVRSIVEGHPPKVVWITRGNCSTDDIEAILRDFRRAMTDFDSDPSTSFLSVS